jgi:microcystin-dependent protein
MSSLKRYNEENSEWEYIAIGKQGPQGNAGPTGPGVPAGGSAGQFLSKVDSANYNAAWVNNFVPPGGLAGEVLLKVDGTNFNTQWGVAVPSGVISPFAGGSVPTGYVLCDGQSLNTTTFANLFAVIGYTYGGSGSSFLVPNLRGRVPVGIDTSQDEFNVRGEVGGAKTHTLTAAQMPVHSHTTPNHSHTFSGTTSTNGNHSHGMQDSYNQGSPTSGPDSVFTGRANQSGWGDTRYVFAAGNHAHSYSGTTSNASPTTNTTGGGQAHNNLQPYMALNYIMKT